VLRERSALAAPAPVDFAPPPGLEHYTATLDPSGVGTDEYQAVRTFLIRAASLPPGPRSALALQLASPLAARLRPPPPSGVSPEQYLACVAAAYQQRQRLAAGRVGASAGGPGAAWGGEFGPVGGSAPSAQAPSAPAPGPSSEPPAPAPPGRDATGEGARPSPVDSGGFAPPG
jgi:hypothetical protein